MSFSLLANKTCTDGVNVFNCTCLPSISIDLSVLNHSKCIKYYVLVFRFLNQSVNITADSKRTCRTTGKVVSYTLKDIRDVKIRGR